MKTSKRKKLENAGWKVGTAQEFLGLSDIEMALIEMKRTLITKIKEIRKTNRITQASLARILESSQSRVAKLEAGDSGVSLDLICRALFCLGLDQAEMAKVIAKK